MPSPTPKLPLPPVTEGLTIQPYGVEVFTDHERGKSFTNLLFRAEKKGHGTALAFLGAVLVDLSIAGLKAGRTVFTLTPVEGRFWNAHVDVQVEGGKP